MKLISEVCEHDIAPLIVEETGQKQYFVTGPFLQAEIKNRNGRIYPLDVLTREVSRYTAELIDENRALGELGHPDSPSINLDRVSHLIVELLPSGKDFIGKAKIMDTPYGKIVKNLIDEKVKLGVSSRGVGTLRSTSQGNVVGEDFYLATAADIVADPSAPNAFVRGIMENKEWVWENGILTEAQIAQYQQELVAAPKKQKEPRKLAEAKVWKKFLDSIRVSVKSPLLSEAWDKPVWSETRRDCTGKMKKLEVWNFSDGRFGINTFMGSIGGKKYGDYDSLSHAIEALEDALTEPVIMVHW